MTANAQLCDLYGTKEAARTPDKMPVAASVAASILGFMLIMGDRKHQEELLARADLLNDIGRIEEARKMEGAIAGFGGPYMSARQAEMEIMKGGSATNLVKQGFGSHDINIDAFDQENPATWKPPPPPSAGSAPTQAPTPAPRAPRAPKAITGLPAKTASDSKTDEDLKETGRQRGVTALAAEAARERGRRGERTGKVLGMLGGGLGGAAAGKKYIGGRAGAIAGLLAGASGGRMLGSELGTELDVRTKKSSVQIVENLGRAMAQHQMKKDASAGGIEKEAIGALVRGAASALKSFSGLKGGTLPFLSRIRTIGQQGIGATAAGKASMLFKKSHALKVGHVVPRAAFEEAHASALRKLASGVPYEELSELEKQAGIVGSALRLGGKAFGGAGKAVSKVTKGRLGSGLRRTGVKLRSKALGRTATPQVGPMGKARISAHMKPQPLPSFTGSRGQKLVSHPQHPAASRPAKAPSKKMESNVAKLEGGAPGFSKPRAPGAAEAKGPWQMSGEQLQSQSRAGQEAIKRQAAATGKTPPGKLAPAGGKPQSIVDAEFTPKADAAGAAGDVVKKKKKPLIGWKGKALGGAALLGTGYVGMKGVQATRDYMMTPTGGYGSSSYGAPSGARYAPSQYGYVH